MGRLEPSKDNSVVGSDATMVEGNPMIVYVTVIYKLAILVEARASRVSLTSGPEVRLQPVETEWN